MSAIGPGSIGALNLAGSVAGTQRAQTDSKEIKSDAAAAQFQIDQRSLSARGLDDVAESEMSPDRDADGRQLFGGAPHQDSDEEPRPDSQQHGPRNSDALGERGNSIDLEG